MGAGAALAVNLLLGLLDRASAIGALINNAQKEGRDVTVAELQSLQAADDTARNSLQKAIDAAKAAGQK